MNEIKKTIEDFVRAGDTNDTKLLEAVLHPKYQNIQDGFFKEKGIYVFSKSEYSELVANKTFGGSPRTIQYDSLEQTGNLAVAKVKLESEYLIFSSTLVCVKENDNWMIISNIPVVELKN